MAPPKHTLLCFHANLRLIGLGPKTFSSECICCVVCHELISDLSTADCQCSCLSIIVTVSFNQMYTKRVLPVPLLPRPHDIQYITIQKFEVGEMFIVFERSILCSPKLNLFDQ